MKNDIIIISAGRFCNSVDISTLVLALVLVFIVRRTAILYLRKAPLAFAKVLSAIRKGIRGSYFLANGSLTKLSEATAANPCTMACANGCSPVNDGP